MQLCYIILLCLPVALSAQTRLRIMEWNVENLFDTRHDSLKNDFEFLPGSERRWTPWRYRQKLNDVAKTIMAAGESGLPDIIGLCEVENDSVMIHLTRGSALRTLGYSYVMTSSDDKRGIDCAMLYQPAHFELLEWSAIRIPSAEHGFDPTRDILRVKGVAGTDDTIHILMCHLPSQRGGRKGKKHRQLAISTLQAAVDSLKGQHVAVMGDFNTHDMRLHGLRHLESRQGTYRYQGDWEQLDHIFISPSLSADTLTTARFPFLLEPNNTYGGDQPRRTYRGPAYHGGISDHLPIWTDIVVSPGTR